MRIAVADHQLLPRGLRIENLSIEPGRVSISVSSAAEGCACPVCARFTAQLRRAEARDRPPSSVPRARKSSVAGLSPTSKNVAALFMRREEKLNDEQEAYLKKLGEADEALADARRLTQEFNGKVRNLEGKKLDGWLGEAEACRAPAMRRFANGLRKDLPAMRASLTEPWSNGPVKGFVHKLKLLKRQGYGRASFELLRARMLAA